MTGRDARRRLRVGVVLGTRPEAIKQAPIALALAGHPGFEPVVISTGQHREMVGPLLAGFGLAATVELDLMAPGQTLTDLGGRALQALGRVIVEQSLDLVVVQGDTTTALAGALAGFYHRVPVVHVEAGLRTDDRLSPYPEEVNRRVITQLADLHLAPSAQAAERLLAEGVDPGAVAHTGNTVVDALFETVRQNRPYAGVDAVALEELNRALDGGARSLLVTAHRRESWGGGIERISTALARLVEANPDLHVVFPLHPNPVVRDVALGVLAGSPRVLTCAPLPYSDLVRVMSRARAVLTDSGGIQEEACSLGIPTLVTRDVTERPEGLAAGGLRLVGTDPATIEREVSALLHDDAAHAALVCQGLPFGDGWAAARSVAAIAALFAPDLVVPTPWTDGASREMEPA